MQSLKNANRDAEPGAVSRFVWAEIAGRQDAGAAGPEVGQGRGSLYYFVAVEACCSRDMVGGC